MNISLRRNEKKVSNYEKHLSKSIKTKIEKKYFNLFIKSIGRTTDL